MSEKYSAELEGILEGIREQISFYFERFEKTNSKAEEHRYKRFIVEYYEVLCKEDNSEKNKILYERAKENLDRLSIKGEVFSPNRKA